MPCSCCLAPSRRALSCAQTHPRPHKPSAGESRSQLASCVFIDPIVFLLHQPKVAQQFLYMRPKDALSAVEHYFIKSEHSIVCYFHRHFFWQENALWASDLSGCPTNVVLSSDDAIVPVDKVQAYLKRRRRFRVTVLPQARHGDFLANADHRDTVLRIVHSSQRSGWRRSRAASRTERQRPLLLRYLVAPLTGAWAAIARATFRSGGHASNGVRRLPPATQSARRERKRMLREEARVAL